MTEQIFSEAVVFTTARVTKPRFETEGAVFTVRHIDYSRMFGLKTIWRGTTKVSISDPARTVLDMLDMPECGGGIDHAASCLQACLGAKGSAGQLIDRICRSPRQRSSLQAPRIPGRNAPRKQANRGSLPLPVDAGVLEA